MSLEDLEEGSHFESSITVADNNQVFFFLSTSTFALSKGSDGGLLIVLNSDGCNSFSVEVNNRIGTLDSNAVIMSSVTFLVVVQHGDSFLTCRQ